MDKLEPKGMLIAVKKKPFNEIIAANLLDNNAKAVLERRLAWLASCYIAPFYEDVMTGKDPDATADLRFKVSRDILDRYLGKPKESIDVSGGIELRIDI